MIFLSEQLKNEARYRRFYNHLVHVFSYNKLEYQLLKNTRDIWLRDFMPIKVGKDKFIQYQYDPDYLKDYSHLCTDPDPLCKTLGLKTIKTDIILDGGNVILSRDYLIMTDKVLLENRDRYSRKALIQKLHELFEVDKVVLTGWDKTDIYGHADGMVRFIDERTVLLSDFFARDHNATGPLRKAGLDIKVLELRKKNKSLRRWAYINFLKTPDIFLLPKLNIPEDEIALEQMKYYYPYYTEHGRMAQVDSTSILRRGGALNCISWEIHGN